MNLVFGSGDENEEFWYEILLRETSEYFTYSYEELRKFYKNEMKINALYFAVIDITGLKVIINDGHGQSRLKDSKNQH